MDSINEELRAQEGLQRIIDLQSKIDGLPVCVNIKPLTWLCHLVTEFFLIMCDIRVVSLSPGESFIEKESYRITSLTLPRVTCCKRTYYQIYWCWLSPRYLPS